MPGINLEIKDATILDTELFEASDKEKFDVIIADVPCSGLGIIGRKNDIKYHVTPESLNSLAEQGVHLKWDNVSQIEKEFGFKQLFVQSKISYHSTNRFSNIHAIEQIPITSSPMDVELLLTHNCNLMSLLAVGSL